jgi:hypothetical protein
MGPELVEVFGGTHHQDEVPDRNLEGGTAFANNTSTRELFEGLVSRAGGGDLRGSGRPTVSGSDAISGDKSSPTRTLCGFGGVGVDTGGLGQLPKRSHEFCAFSSDQAFFPHAEEGAWWGCMNRH